MAKSLQFIADTIDGEIQATPGIFDFPCDQITPIGINVVKSFDEDLGIIAKRVFVIQYNNHSFGSTQFKSLSDFNQYRGIECVCCGCVECYPYINLCEISINGCIVQMCGCKYHDALINNCQILLNGCNVRLN